MTHALRERVIWYPAWEGPILKWTVNFIKKNRWRCDRLHEADDLLQDAYITYRRVEAKYPRVVDAAHFMALYKMAIVNEMWDRARYKKRKHGAAADLTIDAAEYGAGRIGEVTNNGYLKALIAESPDEVKFALALFNNESTDLWSELPRLPRQKPRERENLNMRLNRAYGFKRVRFDFVGAIKALLT